MPRRPRSRAQVSFARIGFKDDQPPLIQDAAAALEDALAPGTAVSRYDRLWRMAQHRRDDGFVVGRIGFEREGQPVWNESAKDFEIGLGSGSTSRFVIDLESFRVVFQLRPGLIAPGTFRYNFQALVNEGSTYDWRVELQGVDQPPWEEWRDEVSRVTKLTITMRRPNPHFPGDRVEQLFEGAKLAGVHMVMNANEGESIDLDDSFIEQAIELAKDHGSYKAEGERTADGQTEAAKWNSTAEGQAEKRDVPADPSTGIPDDEVLKEQLGESDSGGSQ